LELESLIARSLQVLLALGGAYLVATWFVLIIWTFRDIESRSKNVVTQVFSTLLAVFFWIPGVLLYMILRPKETLDEAYQRSLEEEYLLQDLQELPLCPTCNHFVHDDWQLCPHCNTQLKEPCHNCGKLVDLRWDICPYCGEEQEAHEPHRHEKQDELEGIDGWIDPAKIEKRLREEHARNGSLSLPAATAIDRDLLSPAAAHARPSSGDEETITISARSGDDEAGVGKVPVGPDAEDLARGASEKKDDGDAGSTSIPSRFRMPGSRE
jgi:RNA polymerase subunit RPABC4/transcription elongation factor Spt4